MFNKSQCVRKDLVAGREKRKWKTRQIPFTTYRFLSFTFIFVYLPLIY